MTVSVLEVLGASPPEVLAPPTAPPREYRSPTSMCKFAGCPRRYFWNYRLSIERESVQRDTAMDFGSAVHAGMPFTFSARDELRALEAFERVWGDRDERGDKKRNTESGKRILERALAHHTNPTLYTPLDMSKLNPPGTVTTGPHEVVFTVDLNLPSGLPVLGKIDCVGRFGDGVRVVEYKTTSQLWGSFAYLFELSPQVLTYVLAMKAMGIEVVGGTVEAYLAAAGKTDVLSIPVAAGEEKEELVLLWWRWQDVMLSTLEHDHPDDPLFWPANVALCNPYPVFATQGFACEYEPLCLAAERWSELLGLFRHKERTDEGRKENAGE